MAKKMAVRKKQTKQKSFDFEMPRISKAVGRTLAVLLLVAGAGLLTVKGFSGWSEIWPVKQISVQSEIQYLREEDLAAFIQNQEVKGMLAIDLESLQKDVKKIDWIKDVEVRKVWPDQLVFNVEEHLPVAMADGWILTQQGTRIKPDNRVELFAELPSISVAGKAEISSAEYMKIWQEFRQIKRQLELLKLDLKELNVDAVRNWQLNFSSGLAMNLGRKNRTERVSRLVKVYKTIADRKNIKQIDLRYHNGVSVQWFDDQTKELKS